MIKPLLILFGLFVASASFVVGARLSAHDVAVGEHDQEPERKAELSVMYGAWRSEQ